MRNGFTVFAVLVVTSLIATPVVIGTSKALATPDVPETIAQSVTVSPVDVTPVTAAPLPETCNRKVRVVYSGYAPAGAGCPAAR
jgi:hypothetical protein